ncbi:hypothetical protein [Curvibacter lanceolatus]|uniref:hypothetical protein n=1 Tax=Curvibacter lanceolatus TaxID=86182 RepID=UPI000379EC59|nr:hypothetical protein [Curvibacter lanceolatus]
MATIVDALLVTLGLDVSGYKKGQKEAGDSLKKFGDRSAEETKKIEAQGKAMAEGFNKVKNEIISLVAITLGARGVKDFFTNMVNGQAALARQAKNLGVSARELDAWGASVETVGGTAEAFRGSMQAMQAGFEAFKLGENSPVVAAFRALNVNIADSNGKIRPMKDLLLDLSTALKGLSAQDQIRAASMLGLDEGTLNLLRLGRTEIQGVVDQMYRSSGVTEESTQAAIKAQAQWATFRRELYGVGQTIFEALTPALEESNKDLLSLSGWVQTHKGEISGFFSGLATVIGAIARGISDVLGFATSLGEKLATTSVGNKLGELIARVAAYGGSKEANDALAANGVKGYTKSGGSSAPAAPAAATSKAAAGGNLPRGVRNNNPGNLNFVGQEGATREDGPGRFAKFESMEAGIAALVKQLRIYASRGVNTIKAIVEKYAPASENDVGAYISALTKETGLKADDKVDLSNADVLKALVRGITNHENGKGYVSEAQITGGIRVGAAAANPAASRVVNTTTNETNVNGPITINTQAKDAGGIARDLQSALQQQTKMAGLATAGQI